MKYKVKFISMMLVFVLLSMLMPLNLFAEEVAEIEEIDTIQNQCCSSGLHNESTACTHNSNWNFDDAAMTLSGVISIMPVFLLKDLLDDDGYHSAEVLQDGMPVEPGCEIEESMTVQIFHNKELYGEYTVVDVVQASTPPQTTQTTLNSQRAPMRAMSNADTYGFTMPIDNMALPRDIVLTDQNYGWRTVNKVEQFHNGIDITNVNGVWIGTLKAQDRWDIRAVQGGQVVVSNNDTNAGGRGHYVVIKHQFSNIPQGMSETIYTYYQHLANRTVAAGDWIGQGTVVGKIGNSPGDVPVHLHFEIHIGSNGKHVDPVTYLAGAPTYSGPDTHAHTYEYVWYEGTHPHVNYEQCTICGDLRSMGTYAATYEYTYYLTDHPHQQCGMCNICHIEKLTGERKTCNQVAIYPAGDHPHRRYRVYACGADEWLDSYGTCTCK